MNRLTHQRVNGIKSGYWSAAKKEELVQNLAAYENTGLTPEEIMDGKILTGWIPVSERLPERPLQSVIGWDSDYKRPCFAQYIDGKWMVTNPSNWFPNITAWMPLPEPYRENE